MVLFTGFFSACDFIWGATFLTQSWSSLIPTQYKFVPCSDSSCCLSSDELQIELHLLKQKQGLVKTFINLRQTLE